ncbi:MAG: right-handed parallel beta-helix repeat-containing protein [Verrucomicrobia bacterium]|nr:MAG: right-handed parallel beta-helix repeat-containing protein [Verrucomicrobiota bacterium]
MPQPNFLNLNHHFSYQVQIMKKPFIHLIFSLTVLCSATLSAQTLVLNPIAEGPSVSVNGSGGPLSASVELFKNGVSVASGTTTPTGLFNFPNISTTAGDQFYVENGQVWNFNAPGNTQGWSVGADTSVVAGGTWKQTEVANGSDMSVNIYGDNLIRSRGRALEVRMRFQGTGSRAASLILQSAGPNGVAGGGDDGNSAILSTVTLSNTPNFQTYVFDLGINHAGAATCWVDGTAPISISLFIPSTNIGDSIEIDYIRVTESMKWNFDEASDLGEWNQAANTTLTNTGTGVLRMAATSASVAVAMTRPFRVIGSNHFNRLETRLRQVTTANPNIFKWAYGSNPAGYATGGFQLNNTVADGNFQTISIDLTGTQSFGNAWTAGGGATMNIPGDAFQGMFANAAGNLTEVDFIRLHPASRFGPSPVVNAAGPPANVSFFISSSGGNDAANGRTPATAWQTFANLKNYPLSPGTTIHLKRGDLWANSKLELIGKGVSGNPITLTAYGEGNRPRITGINVTSEPTIVWNNPSFVNINSMDCRDAKVGIYLRYTGGNLNGTGEMFNNTDVHISHCYFKNMDEPFADINGNIVLGPPFELSWGAGIWIGGNIPSPSGGPWASTSTAILNNISVKFCGFDQVSTGFGMNFYYPPWFKERFNNVIFEDSWVTGCENGSMAYFYINGGHTRRVDTFMGGNGFYGSGTTGGFIQDMKSYTIEDCEFGFNKRNGTANDGVGFDYEGNTDNVVFQHNVIHNNDGGGMLMINTNRSNQGFVIRDNTFWNNARNPKNADQNREMMANSGNSGTFTNNGIYLGADTLAPPSLAVYNNPTRWTNYSGGGNNRASTPFSAVSSRPTSWDFAASVEGWAALNQWAGFGFLNGAIIGTSSGADPFAESSPTWVNTRERRWVHVRMSQTAGNNAQIFFQTETFPTYTGDKAVTFPIIADGVMRDYIVPMGTASTYRGVVTRFRLDPTDGAGSNMVIDRFESVKNPYVRSVTQISSNQIDIQFNQAMSPDGGVFNVANYSLSGLGKGTAATNPSTISYLNTVGEPIYRLTWNTGHTNGLDATLTLANALDIRGNPLWSASSFTFLTLAKIEADDDNDGMPNAWETTFELNPISAADAADDSDGDGFTNLQEYLSDTDPKAPTSRFSVATTELLGNIARITWDSRPGMVYYIESSTTLIGGSWTVISSAPIVANSLAAQWDAPATQDRQFYRVRAFRPNPLITP